MFDTLYLRGRGNFINEKRPTSANVGLIAWPAKIAVNLESAAGGQKTYLSELKKLIKLQTKQDGNN